MKFYSPLDNSRFPANGDQCVKNPSAALRCIWRFFLCHSYCGVSEHATMVRDEPTPQFHKKPDIL
jgi:hypothetical protein